MNPISLDLRQATRALLRTPGFLVALVLSLALGVGANTAVFSVLRACALGHVAWREPGRLVMVGRRDSDTPQLGDELPVSWSRLQHWRERHDGLATLDGYVGSSETLLGQGEPVSLASLRVTDGFFTTLGATPMLGRLLGEGDTEVAVLSHQAWLERFHGAPEVLGLPLNLGGRVVTVVGVLPPGASWGRTQLFLPLRLTPEELALEDNWINLVGRLPAGGSLGQAREALAVMSARLAPEDNPGRTVLAIPKPFLDFWFSNFRASQRMLGLASVFLLGLAGLNVTVLLLGRGTARAAELGLREALGARRVHLYLPLLTEALVAAVPGILLAFLFAHWAQALLAGFVPGGLQEFHGTGWAELGFAALSALVLVTLSALVPAILLTRANPNLRMRRGGATADPRHRRLSHGLAALQVACALALLSGFALIYTSLRQLQREPVGIDGRRCVVARVNLDLPHEADVVKKKVEIGQLLQRLGGLPGVVSASATNFVPGLDGGWNGTVTVPGYASPAFTWMRTATPGYFKAMGIRFVAGRDFGARDLADQADSVIVSASFARDYYQGREALGQSVHREDRDLRIVGIVGDVAVSSLEEMNRQTLYLPGPLFGTHLDVVVEAKAEPGPLVPMVRSTLRETWPNLPLGRIAPMPELLERSLGARSREALLYGALAGLALAITAAGLFGVLSRDVQERRRELGVRMALGATPKAILAMILRQGLLVVGGGMVLGLVGSAGMAVLLRDSLGKTQPQDPGAHLLALSLLLATALLAILAPALQAARVDPTVSLRSE